MATLAEIATRIPQATAEATGKQLSPIIDTVKDTLNPVNFIKTAGNVLQQEAPIFGMVGNIIGDFAGSLFGGASPEAETADNTEQTEETVNVLYEEQVKTTNALLGNQPILNDLAEAQQVSNEISEQSLQDAQQKEIANLEMMRESSRKEDDVIQLQEEDKEDNEFLQAIMGAIGGDISGLLDFFKTGFVSLLKGGLGTLLKGVVGAGTGLASGAAKAATGIGGLATKGIAAAGGLLPAAGIAVAGASLVSGLFSGVTAGLEEYEKSGDLSSAIKEGGAGFISGATFGLISQETVSETFDAIGSFASETFGGLKDMAGDAFTGLENTFGDFSVFKFITGTIGDAVDSIKNIFSGDFSLENFGSLFGSLMDIVYYPVNLAVNTIKDIFSLGDPEEPFSLSEFISGLITDIYNMIADILPDVDDITSGLPSLSDLTFGLLGGDEPEPQATQEAPTQPAQPAQPAQEVVVESTEPTVSVMMKDGSFQDLSEGEIKRAMDDRTIKRSFAREALRKLKLQGREEGGPVEAGSNYLVGEAGPELFLPNISGTVVNNDETNQLLSRMQTVNTLTRTVEMLASQTMISDMTAEGTAAGGGQTVIAPQTNNNVTNNNVAAQKPSPRNVEPTISRLASMDYYYATP